ncbi:uncharacterized protein isoform X1 [Choristoneura fumiferana]|uniref:uncharacterized protein isoform X1 n=1 Tax=Choristoneura fumiferana TaxID=7141 RepID=UPI003D15D2F9
MNFFVIFVWFGLGLVEASEEIKEVDLIEPRGHAKYALLIHFFYAVATKLIVLKIVYGIIFFVVISKAWHFVLWFIHYLKEKKHEHEYIEIDHDHHEYGHHDFGHHHDFDHGHHEYDHGYHGYGHGHHGSGHHDYGHHDHEPYKGQGYGSYVKDDYYPQKKKGMYDADGSYSVKGAR